MSEDKNTPQDEALQGIELSPVEVAALDNLNQFYTEFHLRPGIYFTLNQLNRSLVPSDIAVLREDVDSLKDSSTPALTTDSENRPIVLNYNSVKTVLVTTSQGIVGEVNNSLAYVTASLSTCTAFVLRVEPVDLEEPAQTGDRVKVVFAHTATYSKTRLKELLEIASRNGKLAELGVSMPYELYPQIEGEVDRLQSSLDPSMPKVAGVEKRSGDGGVIVSNSGVVFLRKSITETGAQKYVPAIKIPWRK